VGSGISKVDKVDEVKTVSAPNQCQPPTLEAGKNPRCPVMQFATLTAVSSGDQLFPSHCCVWQHRTIGLQDLAVFLFLFSFFLFQVPCIRTVFAPGSGMMWTFDKKNLGKRPPPFAQTLQKNLGRRVCVDRVEHIFFGTSRDFFFLEFQENDREGVRSQFQEEKIV
jgi:hypothetical protein